MLIIEIISKPQKIPVRWVYYWKSIWNCCRILRIINSIKKNTDLRPILLWKNNDWSFILLYTCCLYFKYHSIQWLIEFNSIQIHAQLQRYMVSQLHIYNSVGSYFSCYAANMVSIPAGDFEYKTRFQCITMHFNV